MSRADEIINRYLDRMPSAMGAYDHDATYHAQIHFMRRMLTAVDMAMEDEDVPEEIRVRVLRSVIYGAPDEAATTERMEQQKLAAARLSSAPIVGFFTKDDFQ